MTIKPTSDAVAVTGAEEAEREARRRRRFHESLHPARPMTEDVAGLVEASMSTDVKLTDREYARRIVAEHFGYDVVEDVSDQCSEVEFVLMGIKAGRGQPQREAVLEAANIERVARAMDPPLWSDDEEAARMAASPLQVCYARERSLERARLFLTEYTALTTPAPAVSRDELVRLHKSVSSRIDRLAAILSRLQGEA